MASERLYFMVVDVFTTTPSLGNRLAIVHVPFSDPLSPDQKLSIAKEFNFSETVFVHHDRGLKEDELRISIYTITGELPFAGHPTVGTGCHVLRLQADDVGNKDVPVHVTLITPAVRVPVTYSPQTGLTTVQVPHSITIHDVTLPIEHIASLLGIVTADISPNSTIEGGGVAVASIVEGMTFALVRVTSVEALARTTNTGKVLPKSDLGIRDSGNLMVYVYYVTDELVEGQGREGKRAKINRLRSRMFFEGDREDPATGSAASTLAGFLSLTSYAGLNEELRYEIAQGVEMGKPSEITGKATV
jgi:PhzF family phenazine biosynthesis protein